MTGVDASFFLSQCVSFSFFVPVARIDRWHGWISDEWTA
jgi:hypothetical protein